MFEITDTNSGAKFEAESLPELEDMLFTMFGCDDEATVCAIEGAYYGARYGTDASECCMFLGVEIKEA